MLIIVWTSVGGFLRQNIGQLLFIGLQGPELSSEETQFITKNNIGGVILFERNVESAKQLHKLCYDIQGLRQKQTDKAPLFISMDMEGGRVARLKAPFTQWPPLQKLGQIDSSSLAFKMALHMGQELNAVGINLNFAPCVDVLTNPNNQVIGDRALGNDPEHVAKYASALVRGYIKSGIMPCAKHFPGHGNTLADSHEELPVDHADLERLRQVEFLPFKKVFRARLDLVMTAHILFPEVDPDFPVTLSEKFLNEIMKEEFRYRNLIISDDLGMKALTSNYSKEEIPVQALRAGCHQLLFCNDFEAPHIALDSIEKAITDKKLSSIDVQENYVQTMQLKKRSLSADIKPFDEVSSMIGHPDHVKIANAIREGIVSEELLNT